MIGRVTRNWPLKLLALGLAYAIWLAITGEGRITQDYPVPLTLDLPEGLTLSSPAPSTIQVRLRGPENIVRRVDPLRLEARVDLSDAAPGPRTVQLLGSHLSGVRPGVEVVLIEPDRLDLLLDRAIRRAVPVVPIFLGSPPQGYVLYGARAVPETVEVEGPAALVEGLARLRTDAIRLDGRTNPFTASVGALPESHLVHLVGPAQVQVQVDVDSAPAELSLPGVPVVVAGAEAEASAEPRTVSVRVSGPPRLLAHLVPARVRAVADASGLAPRPEPYDIPLRVEFADLPQADLARLSVRSLSRPTAQVRLAGRRPGA